MADPIDNPQNPYRSFVVSASAGSGKTYQLSQRYLRLVAAGADPAEILTVTFTRKAAAEMKERIFADALEILTSPAVAQEVDHQLQIYFADARQPMNRLAPPRPAVAAAEAILTFSQTLKIQTIDSLFQEMVSRFPVEAGSHIPIPFRIASTVEKDELHENGFLQLFEQAEADPAVHRLLAAYLGYAEASTTKLREQLEYLSTERLFFWELQQRRGKIFADFLLDGHPALADYSADEFLPMLIRILQRIADTVGGKTGASIREAAGQLATTGEAALLRGSIFKKDTWDIKDAVGKKIGEDLAQSLLALVYELERLRLNTHATQIYNLFEIYRQIQQQLKLREGLVDFDDLSMGAFNLFYGEESFGARYHLFLRVSHLLVDEFQDTSRIQWDIFSAIAEELLSGQGLAAEKGIIPTVFLVGDAKQSIYAFRQGDYRLLAEAQTHLAARFEVAASALDQSWRSSEVILEQVNRVFAAPEYAHYLPAFRTHSTAQQQGKPVIPRAGSFTLLDQVRGEKGELTADLRQHEAQILVQLIKAWRTEPLLVYDKKTGYHRPLAYRDIGVLYRRGQRAEELERAFIRAGIPHIKEERRGYYSRREVEDIIAFVQFLVQPNDDIAVATLLRSPLLAVSDTDFMRLLDDLQRRAGEPQRVALYTLLRDRYPEIHRKLADSLRRLGSWTLDHILLDFLERTAAFAHYRAAWGPDEGRLAEANLQQLVQILGTTSPPRTGSLYDYLEIIKQYSGVDETGNAQLASDSVTMMTMHKAKGLEFPVVILLGAEEGLRNSNRSTDTGFRKSLIDEKAFLYIGKKKAERLPVVAGYAEFLRSLERDEEEEAMRLLYVALTRAREHFVATATAPCGVDSYYTILQNTVFRDDPGAHREILPGVGGLQKKISPPAVSLQIAVAEVEPPPLTTPNFASIPEEGIRLVRPSQPSGQPDLVGTGADDAVAEVEDFYFALREREKARIIGVLVHQGLSAHLTGRTWRRGEALAAELLNSVHRFDDQERAAIRDTVAQHLDASLQSPALRDLLANTSAIHAELPVLHLDGKSLVHGVIDLLIGRNDGYTVVDFKTVPIDGCSAIAVIKEHGYGRQLGYYAHAVATIFGSTTVRKGVFFTQTGEFVEV